MHTEPLHTEFDRCANNNLGIHRVGEVVEARHRDGQDGKKWYSGVIDKANVQGTYAVRYDGKVETGVRRENIKSRRESRLAAGETLENNRMRKLESLHSASLDPAVKQKCESSIMRTYSKGEGRKKESSKGTVARAQFNTKQTLTCMAYYDVNDKRPLLRATDSQRHKYLNAPVRKQFFPGMWYEGKVTECWKSKGIELFHIKYEDDDEEDVDREELLAILRKEETSAAAPAPVDLRRHEDNETRKYASTSSISNAMPPPPRQTRLVDEGGEGEDEVEDDENYGDEEDEDCIATKRRRTSKGEKRTVELGAARHSSSGDVAVWSSHPLDLERGINDTWNSFQRANTSRTVSTAEWKAAQLVLWAEHKKTVADQQHQRTNSNNAPTHQQQQRVDAGGREKRLAVRKEGGMSRSGGRGGRTPLPADVAMGPPCRGGSSAQQVKRDKAGREQAHGLSVANKYARTASGRTASTTRNKRVSCSGGLGASGSQRRSAAAREREREKKILKAGTSQRRSDAAKEREDKKDLERIGGARLGETSHCSKHSRSGRQGTGIQIYFTRRQDVPKSSFCAIVNKREEEERNTSLIQRGRRKKNVS